MTRQDNIGMEKIDWITDIREGDLVKIDVTKFRNRDMFPPHINEVEGEVMWVARMLENLDDVDLYREKIRVKLLPQIDDTFQGHVTSLTCPVEYVSCVTLPGPNSTN